MKILLVNYRYFVSGGPERYMFNVSDALISQKHEIIPFSIRYKQNQPSPFSSYFVEPLGDEDQVYFRDQRLTLRTLCRTTMRLFYSRDVERNVEALTKDTKPDIAYVLHYLRKLSPSVLVGIKKAGLPIIVRLSDYAMICPQAHCLRNQKPCQLCSKGNLWPSIRFHCVQNSLAASSLNGLATSFHRWKKYFDLIDVFVVTNRFMYNMMVSNGFAESRLCLIPTFVNKNIFKFVPFDQKQSIVSYVGRLENIKGVHIFIDAIALLRKERPDVNWSYIIAGSGEESYVNYLREKVNAARLNDNISFSGNLVTNDLASLLGRSTLSVIPSLWFENLPNSLLESYACGTPVIVSSIGSLCDSVIDNETGYLFQPGDIKQLAEKLAYSWDHRDRLAQMSQNASRMVETIYSEDNHMSSLLNLFGNLLDAKKFI